jgi:small subunit ribosomal protein S1
MSKHDENKAPTGLKDEILKEGEGEMSKPKVDANELDAETKTEESTVTEEIQDTPESPEQPESAVEEATEPTIMEEPTPETESPKSEEDESPGEEHVPEGSDEKATHDNVTSEEEDTGPGEEPAPELPKEETELQEEETQVSEEPEPEPTVEKEDLAEIQLQQTAQEEPAPNPREAHLDQELLNLIDEHGTSFHKGDIKEGTVVDVNEKDVVVDIGFKSDGVIPLHEFEYSGMPEINSKIMVYINGLDNGEGRLSLSKRKADFIKNIEIIKQAHIDGTILPGTIRRRVKGGMIVNVLGIEAFLPGSHMSLKPIPNLDQFIGKEMNFKVMNLDEEHRNIILSRKWVLEEEADQKRQELLSKIEVDSEIDGEVKNITHYGAFIDLGGIDGLLHLTDMSWGKIDHPSDMLSIGDKVKVKVIRFDRETNKISLGLKQLVPHPWENVEIKYPEGVRVTGKVVSVKSFGAFVELEPGVEGLVHISEMSWTKKITDARKIVKVGDVVNAIVLDLDKENRRISLGMKQMDPNPWLYIEDHFPVGSVITRPIKSITAFGAFMEIEDGIDGLIHISDISWTKRIYHPREVFRKGQEVEAVILSIDRALHRIALGVKQLTPDPWEHLDTALPINTEVKGKISKLIPKGVLVDVVAGEDTVEGFIPISHLAIPKLEHSEDAFHVGEELPLKVIELDMENRRLILSVKAFFFSRDPKLQEEYIAIHEQYMRDRLARLQKKREERIKREKERQAKAEAEAAAKEAEAAKAEVEQASETSPEETRETKEPVEVPSPEEETGEPEVVEVPVETPGPQKTEEPAPEVVPEEQEESQQTEDEGEPAAETEVKDASESQETSGETEDEAVKEEAAAPETSEETPEEREETEEKTGEEETVETETSEEPSEEKTPEEPEKTEEDNLTGETVEPETPEEIPEEPEEKETQGIEEETEEAEEKTGVEETVEPEAGEEPSEEETPKDKTE